MAQPLLHRGAMPGLFGWIDLAQPGAPASDGDALLDEMARRMSHTGHEKVETWTDPEGRLAIGHLTLGDGTETPWRSGEADGRPRLFLHGTPRGDLSDLGSRLRRHGREALASLGGSFTLARWEPRAGRITLAVDRRASRPMAYALSGSRLYFAPEVKAILAAPGMDRSLDEAAIGVFMGAGYLLGHQTLFASIRRLAGGEALVAEPGRVEIEPYWRYRLCAEGDGTAARDLEEELSVLVRAAVERDLGDPDRTVVFLSGGVDSRAIAAAALEAARRRGKSLRTVTWAAPGFSAGRADSDHEVAAKVAGALGTRHALVERRVDGWGRRLVRTTYLLDGLTDVPAYHPHEHDVMCDLAGEGVRTVVRGDECFGWESPCSSIEEAWLSLNLRSPRRLHHLSAVARPAVLAHLSSAAEAALAEASRPLAAEHPDDAKDHLYFRHRLQGYLGSAAYLKQVVLDHRAPLLDEALLDFNARVPASLRAQKLLFCRAAARIAPEVFRIPLARRANLEDWGLLLSSWSPVRRYVEAEIEDRESGIWELFDPEALRAALPEVGRTRGRASAWLEREAKKVAKAGLGVMAKGVERRLVCRAHAAGMRVDQVCLRVMVLKAWHDLFVRGDGSRRALEQRLARVG